MYTMHIQAWEFFSFNYLELYLFSTWSRLILVTYTLFPSPLILFNCLCFIFHMFYFCLFRCCYICFTCLFVFLLRTSDFHACILHWRFWLRWNTGVWCSELFFFFFFLNPEPFFFFFFFVKITIFSFACDIWCHSFVTPWPILLIEVSMVRGYQYLSIYTKTKFIETVVAEIQGVQQPPSWLDLLQKICWSDKG